MSKQTILAIDDLVESLDLYESLIRKYIPDTECRKALNGKIGLQLANESPPDLILVDAKMPGMDGFEIVNRLRENPITAPIPILMVSGVMTTHENRISGFASGADGYICKPFQTEEFIAEISVLLRIKNYEDQLRKQEQHLEEELKSRTGDLVESEARFRILFEESPDAIFVESPDRIVLDVNEAACKLHEMTREELIGISVTELVPERIRESVQQGYPNLFSGESQMIESLSLTKGGEEIPVEIRTKQIHYKKTPVAILIVRDIRQRKRIEMALQTIAKEVSPLTGFSFFYGLVQQLGKVLEADFIALTKLLPDEPGFVETFAFYGEGKILDNIKYPLAGRPCEKVYEQNVFACGDNVQEAFPADEALKELNIRSYIGCPLIGTDGHSTGHIFFMSRTPVEDTGLHISMLRIFGARAAAEFERIKATESLWKSEERHRSLNDDVLDRSLVGLFILDKNHEVVWANQILSTYLHVDRDTMIGLKMEDLVESQISSQFSNPAGFKRAMLLDREHFVPGTRQEFHIPPKPGTKERWLEHFSQPIRTGLYAGGRIEHFSDITRQKTLQEQLLQVQKMEGIGRLAGGVAHDFNNLLTSILGFSHLLLDELEEKSPLRESVDEIIHAGQLAEKLTRQLLVFGRKQVMQVRPINLNTVVTEMNQLLHRTLGEDIELVSTIDPDLPSINADPGQVEQIIMNLAVNARDAMPYGGKLTVDTRQMSLNEADVTDKINARPGNYVCLTVSDTGEGMTEDIVRHVFEPFFTTKDHDKGTGLGLSIVYGIVEQFHGFIEVSSEKGLGTSVQIFLPKSEMKAVNIEHGAEENLPRGTGTILVVEDERTVRHLTVRILASLGYKVLTAGDAEQALEIYDAKCNEIDLILSDVVMPKMSGKELADELGRRGKPFRIIYTSGFTEDRIEDHGISADAHRLILKPYSRETLATTVFDVLKEPMES
jgi:PAS domain S-box-containing protein